MSALCFSGRSVGVVNSGHIRALAIRGGFLLGLPSCLRRFCGVLVVLCEIVPERSVVLVRSFRIVGCVRPDRSIVGTLLMSFCLLSFVLDLLFHSPILLSAVASILYLFFAFLFFCGF